jgi:hypothetical protein
MQAPSPIRCATALSVLGHGALLLLFGAPVFLPWANSVPTLTLTVTMDNGRDQDQERAPRHPQEVQRGPAAEKPVTTARATDQRPTAIEPDDDTGRSDPAPPPPLSNSENGSALPEAVADSGSPQAAETTSIVTTTGASEFVAPTGQPVRDAAVALEVVPSSQQALLTHKVLKWAQGLQDFGDTPSQLTWQQDGRQYTAVIKRRPATSNTDIESAIVEIATLEDGKELRTQLHLKRLAFSHFTQLVDKWDANVQLHDDEVVGRFHSNTEITLGYDRSVAPRFNGKVSTAAGGFTIAGWSSRRPREEIFPAGLETRAGRISLPNRFLKAVTNNNTNVTNAQYHTFDRDTRITFYADGTYGWKRLDSKASETRAALGKIPMLMIADRGTELHVIGTVNGNVLVYSPECITVEGNLVYAHDPRQTPDAQDYLGLASDVAIEVAGPEVTGPGNIEIDAAIYARRRFTVTAELSPDTATLFIFGSLTAGTISATEPRYATHIQFDPRFEHTRPPGFPMTNHYEVEQWDGVWRAVGGEDD